MEQTTAELAARLLPPRMAGIGRAPPAGAGGGSPPASPKRVKSPAKRAELDGGAESKGEDRAKEAGGDGGDGAEEKKRDFGSQMMEKKRKKTQSALSDAARAKEEAEADRRKLKRGREGKAAGKGGGGGGGGPEPWEVRERREEQDGALRNGALVEAAEALEALVHTARVFTVILCAMDGVRDDVPARLPHFFAHKHFFQIECPAFAHRYGPESHSR